MPVVRLRLQFDFRDFQEGVGSAKVAVSFFYLSYLVVDLEV